MEIIVAPSAHHADQLFAAWVGRRIRSAVRLRGECRVALSGGSSIGSMFEALAARDLPWASVLIFQVDERVAPDGDPDRNAVALVEHLVEPAGIPDRNVRLMPVTRASLRRAAGAYAEAIGAKPLDVVHLGVGDDGHTASWAPGDPVADVTDPVGVSGEYRGRVRMTLTPASVNAARSRGVLASGANKAEPLAGWLLHRLGLPIERVRREQTTLFTDEAGAALIPHQPPR